MTSRFTIPSPNFLSLALALGALSAGCGVPVGDDGTAAEEATPTSSAVLGGRTWERVILEATTGARYTASASDSHALTFITNVGQTNGSVSIVNLSTKSLTMAQVWIQGACTQASNFSSAFTNQTVAAGATLNLTSATSCPRGTTAINTRGTFIGPSSAAPDLTYDSAIGTITPAYFEAIDDTPTPALNPPPDGQPAMFFVPGLAIYPLFTADNRAMSRFIVSKKVGRVRYSAIGSCRSSVGASYRTAASSLTFDYPIGTNFYLQAPACNTGDTLVGAIGAIRPQ